MAGTDLLCNLPDHLSAALSKTGVLHGEPLPFVTPEVDLSMAWLSVMDTDPAERWLRSKLEQYMSYRENT